ncbi:response regulator transcription factor [Lacunisphaera limnophila]|nr:response regulator transcription factor [Lacunisphaera limnophila]
MKPVVRVVIVEDHVLFREMVTTVVNGIEGLRVVGWACNESEAITLCWRERPDLIVLDLILPENHGVATLDRLTTICRSARVLVFSGNLTPGLIRQVLAAGPHSLIGKGATLDEFRRALQAVAAGRTYFSPEIAADIRSMVAAPGVAPPGGGLPLSPREESVLAGLAKGLNSREIAGQLGLSPHTVANHRSRLMRKLGLHRVAQLSLYAASRGLLDLPASGPRTLASGR